MKISGFTSVYNTNTMNSCNVYCYAMTYDAKNCINFNSVNLKSRK